MNIPLAPQTYMFRGFFYGKSLGFSAAKNPFFFMVLGALSQLVPGVPEPFHRFVPYWAS